jgi:RES domain-containing protein
MLVWRLTRKAHSAEPLNGEGAKRFGGRWNHVGNAVVYTSASLSLAVLEYLVHLPISDLPDDLISIQLRFPDDLPRTEFPSRKLPDNWRRFPAIEELQDLGTDWVRAAKTAILMVPSVVIPSERNYLINPEHSEARQVEVISSEPFALDIRLYRSRKRTRFLGR